MAINFLKKRKVNNVTPSEWMSKSPDAAPVNFSLWNKLKRRLQLRKIYAMSGLKSHSKANGAVMHKPDFRKVDEKV
jgi:hypothetical protein